MGCLPPVALMQGWMPTTARDVRDLEAAPRGCVQLASGRDVQARAWLRAPSCRGSRASDAGTFLRGMTEPRLQPAAAKAHAACHEAHLSEHD